MLRRRCAVVLHDLCRVCIACITTGNSNSKNSFRSCINVGWAYLWLCCMAAMTTGLSSTAFILGLLAATSGLAASSAKYGVERNAAARGELASSASAPGAKLVPYISTRDRDHLALKYYMLHCQPYINTTLVQGQQQLLSCRCCNDNRPRRGIGHISSHKSTFTVVQAHNCCAVTSLMAAITSLQYPSLTMSPASGSGFCARPTAGRQIIVITANVRASILHP